MKTGTLKIWLARLFWITMGFLGTGLISILIACTLGMDLDFIAVITMWYAIQMYGSLILMVGGVAGIVWMIKYWRDDDS